MESYDTESRGDLRGKNANGVDIVSMVLSIEPTSFDSSVQTFRNQNGFLFAGVDARLTESGTRGDVRNGFAFYAGVKASSTPSQLGSDLRRRFLVINGLANSPDIPQWQILHSSNHYRSSNAAAIKAAIDSIKPGVAVPVGLGYEEWKQAQALPPESSGPQDDADGDGAKNLLEFFTGRNPKVADAAEPLFAKSTDLISFEFTEAKNLRGVSFALQGSADLATWKQVPTPEAAVTRTDAGATNRVQIKLDPASLEAGVQFLRLAVTLAQ